LNVLALLLVPANLGHSLDDREHNLDDLLYAAESLKAISAILLSHGGLYYNLQQSGPYKKKLR
jgi:hypothetical protein